MQNNSSSRPSFRPSELRKLTSPCDSLINNNLSTRKTKNNAYYNRGVIHFYTAQLDAAHQDFTQVIQLTPNLHEAHIALAEIAIKKGELTLARERYQAAHKQLPDDKAVAKKLAWLDKKIAAESDNLLSQKSW